MDTDRLNQILQNITQRIQNLAYQCTDHHLGHCRQIIDEYGLVSKLNRAGNLQKDLNREALELSRQTELKNTFKMPVSMRLRRTTPMLGFIGGIVGPVAGLLTYEDGEAIDNKLQELNEAQANISHLVGLQTHVVKAQLHDLHEQASKNQEKLKYYDHQLSQVAQNLHDVTRFYEGYNYMHALSRLIKVIEAALDEETLDHLEQQLNEISHHKYANKTQDMLIHGSYLGIGIILSGTLLYFCHAKILAGLATFGICACRKRSTRQIPDAENVTTINEGHQQQNEATLSMSNSAHNVVPVTTPRANPNQTPTSMSDSARNQTATAPPRIQLPIQSLHPA